MSVKYLLSYLTASADAKPKYYDVYVLVQSAETGDKIALISDFEVDASESGDVLIYIWI